MKKNVFLLFLITSFLIGCTVDVPESASKDTTPPGAITNLSVKSDNKSITLSWNNPTDEDFSGTSITFTPKVNSITQPVIVEGIPSKTSTKTFSGLRNNVEYSFTLVALDKNENGSEPASIKATPADTTPPAEVRNLTATVNENSIKLEWLNPSDEDFYGVEISLTPATANFSQPMFMKGNPSEKKELTVKNLETEEDYTFTVKSIDIYNNKSSGIQRKATTKPSSLTLDVVLPNDGDNIIFTNDEAPIKVTVTSSNEITKAVWKKGTEGISVEPNLLLNDSDATSFSITTKTPEVILYVTENGIYDIAAQNEKGIIDYKQVEIKTIDKNPLPAVTNLSVNYEHEIEYKKYGRIRYIEWTNPVPENTYDAPIKDIIISCIYNDNETDTDNTILTINDTSTQNYSFELSDKKTLNDYVHFNIKIIDTAGNESEITCSAKTDCGPVFVTDIENVPSIIQNAISIGETKIITIGDFADTSNEGALEKIAERLQNVDSKRIHLDLSKTKNLETLTSFEGCNRLKSIILPEGVKEIEVMAFGGCDRLSKITIPKSVTTISGDIGGRIKEIYYTGTLEEWCSKKWNPDYISGAYDLHINNEKVENANIQKGITSICDNAFRDCKSLSSIVIPEGVSEIGNYAFNYCTNLSSIVIPEGVKAIEKETFSGCDRLSKITIPKSVTTISGYIGGSITEIYYTGTLEEWCSKKWRPSDISSAYDLYINNEKVENANIKKGITSICDNAFRNCKSLSSIVIPEGVSKIGDFAFQGCENLSSIVIPKGVSEIGNYAFSNCSNLSSIILPEGLSEIGNHAFYYCTNLSSIILPEGLSEIDDCAFYQCSNLSSIVIPATVTKIGYYAFDSCSNLTYIEMPGGIEFGYDPFFGCCNISSITFLENEKTSIDFAFLFSENTKNLTKITIPNTIKNIEDYRHLLVKYADIKEIHYQGTLEDWCSIEFSSGAISSSYDLYLNNEKLENANIKDGTPSISNYTFYGCSSLSSIVIPESVTEIGNSAFENCTGLSNIDIQEGVTKIGKTAFGNCSSLTNVIIPKTVTVIGSSAFENCTSLSAIDISEGVTVIGDGVFSNCSSLTEIIIPKTVTVIGQEAFSDCTNLTSVELPSDITELERKVFYNCNKLETITIPSTVTLLYSTTFEKCDKLSYIRFRDTKTRWYKYTAKENEINKPLISICCKDGWTWAPSSDSIGKMLTYEDKSFFTNNDNYAIFYNENYHR